MAELINRSVNQTLSRTILTSGTTFLATLSLFLVGGGVIDDFALTVLIGVVVGTLSSILTFHLRCFWRWATQIFYVALVQQKGSTNAPVSTAWCSLTVQGHARRDRECIRGSPASGRGALVVFLVRPPIAGDDCVMKKACRGMPFYTSSDKK